jgi:hypothetical protein
MSDRYDLPEEIQVEIDGPVRIVRFNRPDDLNATNHVLHKAIADVFPQLDADPTPGRRSSPATAAPSRRAGTSGTSTSSSTTRPSGGRRSATGAGW